MDQETQSTISEHLKNWSEDIGLAIALLTRIPVPQPADVTPDRMARAQRAFPLVGAIVGLAAGLVDRCLLAIGIPELAAAAVALGAGALLTGALHEDGLADVGDGFGGGRDREKKLAIMRDSRIGTYGVLALLVSFVARCSALASLPIAEIIPALIVAHALARAAIPVVTANMPFAREDGLGRVGRPARYRERGDRSRDRRRDRVAVPARRQRAAGGAGDRGSRGGDGCPCVAADRRRHRRRVRRHRANSGDRGSAHACRAIRMTAPP